MNQSKCFKHEASIHRIIVPFQDEGSFHLKSDARQYLKDMGSEQIENLAFRDTWVFITKKGGKLWKESLNSDSKIFQPISPKPTITSHLNSLTMTYEIGNPVPSLRQAQKCGWLKWLIQSQSSPLDNWISNKQMI